MIDSTPHRRGEWARWAVGVIVAVGLALGIALLVHGRMPGPGEGSLLPIATISAAVGAAAVVPVGRGVARLRRRLREDHQRPDAVLRLYGRDDLGLPPAELLAMYAESVRYATAARRVEVHAVGDDGQWTAAATAPPTADAAPLRLGATAATELARLTVAGPAWLARHAPALVRDAAVTRVAPAVHDGELVGVLLVADDRDRPAAGREVADAARRLGQVLHHLHLGSALRATLADLRRTNVELVASRARLVAAADDERRRIERDIHDGAQQQLVAIAVGLRLARDLAADSPAVVEVLDELVEQARDAVTSLRDLAHGVYPTLLVQSGLDPALRAAATRSGLPVTVDVTGPRPPHDVETAVYFCCLESLQNVAKHAPDATVHVRVWTDGDRLRFLVSDDGPGFVTGVTPAGHGVQNITDRIGAVDGSVRWRTAPGAGTTVEGEVPVPVAAPVGAR